MKKTKVRLFLYMWIAGMLGVLSLLFLDLNALVREFPLPEGTNVPEIGWGFKLLSLIQPSVLVAIAVFIGVGLASKVGLSAPVFESAAKGNAILPLLKPMIAPGIIAGIVAGIGIILITLVMRQFLPADAIARISKLGGIMPNITRFLYGGITEELLLRWGLMTLLVWLGWRLVQKSAGEPRSYWFHLAIVLSAVIFGIGHLPIAFLIVPDAGAALVLMVIAANSLFGLIAGYLYWKKGLESAIIAHVLTHVVLITASYFGAYF